MDPALTPDVFASPAVAILCGLEHDGFTVELTPDNALVITPKSRLTADRMQTIVTSKDALKLLLRCRDRGVQARRDVFAFQLAQTAAPGVPSFLFKSSVAYVKGICFSCGDALPELRFSRCWRCSLAWRLACRLPVSAEFAMVIDGARRVA